jgi:hypothetical protein
MKEVITQMNQEISVITQINNSSHSSAFRNTKYQNIQNNAFMNLF